MKEQRRCSCSLKAGNCDVADASHSATKVVNRNQTGSRELDSVVSTVRSTTTASVLLACNLRGSHCLV